ncbi:helix-turn-helix transcriptional regulator [Actinomyces minihominis]|uniref:helix-turn-helix transcriptional regulator n=1 Tax=Actinomyces minihominis TaxID=2002838 RepID=UPI0013EA4C91|nr:helix-turn-helix transcriptional regulator [Actinomyces minihominis]
MSKLRDSEVWAEYARDLGDILHSVRRDREMSQESVAYAAGLSRYTYQRLERGLDSQGATANPTLTTLVAIANALDVGVEDILPARDLPEFH